ncbi:PaaI family thioesterase [Rhodococcus sp. IEGM 1241]|uniref:PaaI family thioesterase n=1 Tax=Rhodococcus sp. IEGM 1241 TaxID=3082228 RepID=UPI0029543FD4|nr:PaaI family thioesterase [Rhodococcus sp. IEGM 1241]MDV8013874.1 PaaI family thioesterase [Rhodococcus sp. IEGM 1241]
MTTKHNEAISDAGELRTKTVSWHNPHATAAAGHERSGLEFLTAWMRGETAGAPICELINARLIAVDVGDVVFACEPDESVYNPIGMVHGGLACTLLDSAAGCAVHSTLPIGLGYSSIEIKVNFLRPIHAGKGEIFARGRVTKPGKRIAFAEAEVQDSSGTVLATASSSCLIVPV